MNKVTLLKMARKRMPLRSHLRGNPFDTSFARPSVPLCTPDYARIPFATEGVWKQPLLLRRVFSLMTGCMCVHVCEHPRFGLFVYTLKFETRRAGSSRTPRTWLRECRRWTSGAGSCRHRLHRGSVTASFQKVQSGKMNPAHGRFELSRGVLK